MKTKFSFSKVIEPKGNRAKQENKPLESLVSDPRELAIVQGSLADLHRDCVERNLMWYITITKVEWGANACICSWRPAW